MDEKQIVKNSGYFDSEWYVKTYQDVQKARIDPLLHYCNFGHREGRDPGPNFSTSEYRAKNRDCGPTANPVVHCVNGKKSVQISVMPKDMSVRKRLFEFSRKDRVYKTLPKLPEKPSISVIIPTAWKKPELTEKIMGWLSGRGCQVIMIDNSRIESHKTDIATVIVDSDVFNWSHLNNVGAKIATGDILIFLNDDTEVIQDDWLDKLIEPFDDLTVGCVGPVTLNPDGSVQGAGARLRMEDSGVIGLFECPAEIVESQTIGGSCMAIRRDVYDDVGGFDEGYIITHSDTEMGLRIGRHYKVLTTPHSTIRHYERSSRPAFDLPQDRDRFWAECGLDILKHSAAYHAPSASITYPEVLIEDSIKHILLVKLDHFGDVFIVLEQAKKLRDRLSHAKFTVLCGPWAKGIFEKAGFNNIITAEFFGPGGVLGGRKTLSQETLKTIADIKPDLAIDLRAERSTRNLLSTCGATFTCGYEGIGFTPDFSLPCLEKRFHNGKQIDLLIERLPLAQRNVRHNAASKTIALNPAASADVKKWPIDRWVGLSKRLKSLGMDVLLCGGPDDQKDLQNIARQAAVQVMGIVSIQDFAETIAEKCLIYVGNDTGPTHAVASYGVPVVEVMGGMVPCEEWMAYGQNVITLSMWTPCTPCYNTSCPHGKRCLQVNEDDVLWAIGTMLNRL